MLGRAVHMVKLKKYDFVSSVKIGHFPVLSRVKICFIFV